MKTSKTLEGNKLIAEFMITQKPSDDFCVNWKDKIEFSVFMNGKSKTYLYSKLKFHSSWDWLMPVVEKIEDLGHGVTIYRKGCQINDVHCTNTGFRHNSKIEETYQAVIEFIKWYNENK